ncbi:gliding motility-associated C-terminal domain-containing protein, partial [Bacteroidales bacterium AH-315-I05]|nr:gliding motility-associated C-terminal domain-containing protein [Bacteroidales bacterium AH-315-I05]
EQQLIGGTDTTKFFNIEIINTSNTGIILGKSIIVQDTLFLIDGIVNTDTNKVIITNTDSASISGYQQGATTPSFINGNLRRYADNLNNSYGFPVGENGVYYLQEIEINSINGIINYFDSHFGPLVNHLDVDLNVTEDGKSYNTVCNEGVWYLVPNQQASSISYDCWSYIGNFTNCNVLDNYFAILTRPDASMTAADWDCNNCGIGAGLNPDNGDGRLVSNGYALRKNLNSFSQFGIGKMVDMQDSVVVDVEFFIPNMITPNSDGKNDFFQIAGLEKFPNNQLIIMNRWGNMVFESGPYQNQWNGQSQLTGETLTNGTYFYLLKLNDESKGVYTGYVEILK